MLHDLILTLLQEAYDETVAETKNKSTSISNAPSKHKEKENKKTMKVKIDDKRKAKSFFNDLELNESFTIEGKNVVYRKVCECNSSRYFMMEESSGRFFPPTASPLTRVQVKITIENV